MRIANVCFGLFILCQLFSTAAIAAQNTDKSDQKQYPAGGILEAPPPIPSKSRGEKINQVNVPQQSSASVDRFEKCAKVVNDRNNNGVFVPLNSLKEWDRFKNSPPVQVVIGDCDEDILEEGPVDEGVIAAKCSERPLKSKVIKVHFPNPQNSCQWGKEGNYLPRNGYFQARNEQEHPVNLPDSATMCGAEFSFSPQRFWYDDSFIMAIDDNIVVASNDWTSRLENKNGFLQYDWEKMVGMKGDMSETNAFCPNDGNSSSYCRFPPTDKTGSISLGMSSDLVKKAMANSGYKKHSIKFVTTGDNDGSDCKHFDVEFDMKITYVD